MTYCNGSRERLVIILIGGFGAAAGGFWGATAGIFLLMPVMARYIGPPLSWLLGVAVGGVLGTSIGALGASIGCYLMLRLIQQTNFR